MLCVELFEKYEKCFLNLELIDTFYEKVACEVKLIRLKLPIPNQIGILFIHGVNKRGSHMSQFLAHSI